LIEQGASCDSTDPAHPAPPPIARRQVGRGGRRGRVEVAIALPARTPKDISTP